MKYSAPIRVKFMFKITAQEQNFIIDRRIENQTTASKSWVKNLKKLNKTMSLNFTTKDFIILLDTEKIVPNSREQVVDYELLDSIKKLDNYKLRRETVTKLYEDEIYNLFVSGLV